MEPTRRTVCVRPNAVDCNTPSRLVAPLLPTMRSSVHGGPTDEKRRELLELVRMNAESGVVK